MTGQAVGLSALWVLSLIPVIVVAPGAALTPAELGLFPNLPNEATTTCSRVVAVKGDGSLLADMYPGVMKERIRIIDPETGNVLQDLNPRGGQTCDMEFSS